VLQVSVKRDEREDGSAKVRLARSPANDFNAQRVHCKQQAGEKRAINKVPSFCRHDVASRMGQRPFDSQMEGTSSYACVQEDAKITEYLNALAEYVDLYHLDC
jgi:hypothetical protein